MADCKKYREMISCYVDGELSENDNEERLRHLDKCASCRSLLSLYTSIAGAAAESLVEPPDNFAESIMNKIRMLPENEQIKENTAYRPKKSLKPVVISFVAAAACLALAFTVSPQLFGFGSSKNTTSMPMASASSYVAESQQDVPNVNTQYAKMQTADSSSAAGSEASPTASTAEDGTGALPPPRFGVTAVTESPQPSVDKVPDFTVSGYTDTDELKDYYAVFVIIGRLPDILENYGKTENEDGTFSIEISVETANQLIKDDIKAEMGAPDAANALVKYTPASST